jgi:hypothetical protein
VVKGLDVGSLRDEEPGHVHLLSLSGRHVQCAHEPVVPDVDRGRKEKPVPPLARLLLLRDDDLGHLDVAALSSQQHRGCMAGRELTTSAAKKGVKQGIQKSSEI